MDRPSVLEGNHVTAKSLAFDDMTPERREKRLNELGYNDMNSMLQGSCACIRAEIKDITPRQWAESSLTRYQEYLKRKQTGMPVEAAPSTPLEEALNHCIRPQRANTGK
jgi:hypothetical protein